MAEAQSYEKAVLAAKRHRIKYGDDVVLHDPEDEGWAFICEDCGWVQVVLAHIPDDAEWPS